MSNTRRQQLREIMQLCWQFIKRNGFTLSHALKTAWANIKLKEDMNKRIVKFYYQKIDGSLREAYGTLQTKILPPTQGSGKKRNDNIFIYFDTEKSEYRSFKRANLIKLAQ